MRSGIMLAKPLSEKDITYPCFLQPKLDGIRCRYDKGILVSSTKKLFSDRVLPHIYEKLKDCPFHLDGELYIDGHSFEEINSICQSDVNIHPDIHKIQYHIFDIISNEPQYKRLKALSEWFVLKFSTAKTDKPIQSVCTYKIMNKAEFDVAVKAIKSTNCEGFMYRSYDGYYNTDKRTTDLMKHKEHFTDTYTIIGTQHLQKVRCLECNQTKLKCCCENSSFMRYNTDEIGALNVISDDNPNTIFTIGSGLTNEQRKRKDLIGKKILVKYQSKTIHNMLRHPVVLQILDKG